MDTARFSPGAVGDHYVLVSELMAHKQIDVAIAAFNRLRLPLVVIGDGPDYRRLKRQAGPTIHFTGRLPDASVAEVLQSARALIVTSIEEFGIAAVESQASGRPVIARRGGGALETIVDGRTGCLWSGGADELARAVLEFDDAAIDPRGVRPATRRPLLDVGELPAQGMLSTRSTRRSIGRRASAGQRHRSVSRSSTPTAGRESAKDGLRALRSAA